MCDEQTEAENETYLTDRGLRRRELGLGATAAMATLLTGCSKASTPPSTTPEPTADAPTKEDAPAAAVRGSIVTIDTPDGSAEAYFVTPGSGKHPAVLVWPDIAGLRPAFQTMADRLAEAGYAVLAVNLYYRSSKLPVLEKFDEWRTDEGQAKIRPMVEALTPEGITSDASAFVAWLDGQEQVDTSRRIGTTGYCMGGSFTFRTAVAAPERVGALGSFHGGGLVTEDPNSPHQLLGSMKAAALVCIAQNDDARQPEAKATLKQAAEAAGRTAEVEVYAAQHGWCVIDSPVYDEPEAERAWGRMLATFEAHL